MKNPAEAIVGFLFAVTAMIFWYGGYTVFYIQHVFVRYWWAIIAVGISFGAGRIL